MEPKNDDYMKRKQYRYTNDIFIEKAKEVHGEKYDYSEINYINKRTKVKIKCPIHGVFMQLPMNHIRGQGCPECGKIIAQKREMPCKNKRKTKEEFQKDINQIYGDKYEVIGEYINNKTKILMFCHKKNKNGKEHGEFYAKPNDLICGHGCHKCVHSKLEDIIEDFLISENIEYETQKRFSWMGRQSIDFYLPYFNIGIECQGKQHFEPVDFKGKGLEDAMQKFQKIKENDEKKNSTCAKHGIKILYYTDIQNCKNKNYKYDIFLNTNILLNEILKNGKK